MKAAALGVLALVLVAFLMVPMVAASNADNDLYTSKYAATPQTTETLGMMTGQLRAGMPGLTTGVSVTELATGAVRTLEIRPDGTFEMTGTPGRYLITIADGNGGQPEQAYFNIVAGQVSQIESELLGHAIPPALVESKDKIVILEATYGMTKKVIDRVAVPAVPGVPAVTHTEQQCTPDVYSIVDHGQFTGYAKEVGSNSPHDFTIGGQKYQIVGNAQMHNPPCGSVKYLKVCGHCTTVTIIDSPAIPAVPAVTELSHMEGSYIDVTAQVAQMTSAENPHQSFAFNNAMNPGGIVNVAQDTVLVAIADPAYGQVKNVMIKYTLNGAEITLDTMEYETINL